MSVLKTHKLLSFIVQFNEIFTARREKGARVPSETCQMQIPLVTMAAKGFHSFARVFQISRMPEVAAKVTRRQRTSRDEGASSTV